MASCDILNIVVTVGSVCSGKEHTTVAVAKKAAVKSGRVSMHIVL